MSLDFFCSYPHAKLNKIWQKYPSLWYTQISQNAIQNNGLIPEIVIIHKNIQKKTIFKTGMAFSLSDTRYETMEQNTL